MVMGSSGCLNTSNRVMVRKMYSSNLHHALEKGRKKEKCHTIILEGGGSVSRWRLELDCILVWICVKHHCSVKSPSGIVALLTICP